MDNNLYCSYLLLVKPAQKYTETTSGKHALHLQKNRRGHTRVNYYPRQKSTDTNVTFVTLWRVTKSASVEYVQNQARVEIRRARPGNTSTNFSKKLAQSGYCALKYFEYHAGTSSRKAMQTTLECMWWASKRNAKE